MCLQGGCYSPAQYGDGWNPTKDPDKASQNIAMMRAGDRLAFVLASFVVALEIGAEAYDIVACQRRAQGGGSRPIRATLWLLVALRQYALLPCLAAAVVRLVLFRSTSALDIFFNALAVIFMLQIDDSIFAGLLSEEMRAELEGTAELQLDADALKILEKSQLAVVLVYTSVMLLYIQLRFRMVGVII